MRRLAWSMTIGLLLSVIVALPAFAEDANDTSCPTKRSHDRFITLGNFTYDEAMQEVSIEFELKQDCQDVELTLASYTNAAQPFTWENAEDQILVDDKTAKFDGGEKHKVTVDYTPSCAYQIDFVFGGVIETFGPEGTDNYFSKRNGGGDGDRDLIKADNKGPWPCEGPTTTVDEGTTTMPSTTVVGPTTTVDESTTTTPSTTEGPTTTVVTEAVLVGLETPTTPSTPVAAAEGDLPFTGSSTTLALLLALPLLAVGASLVLVVRRRGQAQDIA